MKTYQIIPEKDMIEMSKEVGGNNVFAHMLSIANEYKAANVVPIYLLDNEKAEILVLGKDYLNKKLH